MPNKKQFIRKPPRLPSAVLREKIPGILGQYPGKTFAPLQLIKLLKCSNSKDSVLFVLNELVASGKIMMREDGTFGKGLLKPIITPAAKRTSIREGRVDKTRSGSAFVHVAGLEQDVFIPSRHMKDALDNDLIELRITSARPGRRPEGEVIRILERGTEHFIGTYRFSRKQHLFIPDREDLPWDIECTVPKNMIVENGDKVVVRITQWPKGRDQYASSVITLNIGKPGTNDHAMQAILINNGFPLGWPEGILEETAQLQGGVTADELAKRRDLRGVCTFTIDPHDAKDFDDALSLQFLEEGKYEIGVHIADVTHYVRPGSLLDKEAYSRSTSVYLVDRVLPMLPEKISNELCSLRPNEDKYTFSAIFTYNSNHQIIERWFGKTIIHSQKRFAYEEAQEVIDSLPADKQGGGSGILKKELDFLNTRAIAMRKARFAQGAIGFETEEIKFRLDAQGFPIEIYVKERQDAHMLIEEYMLLANREVATWIANKSSGQEIPMVYRVHDLPDTEKVADFARFARELGFPMKTASPKQIAESFNQLAEAAEKNEILRMLEPLAIRCMAKAVYTTVNIGHYGLAFEYYSHFTSPIRRYSDVLAHRILEKNLTEDYRMDRGELEKQCGHISQMERRAMEAERESIRYKQVEFLNAHVGGIFTGIITGVHERGLFVSMLENHCEGMIHLSSLNEPFEVDRSSFRVTGVRSRKIYKVGDQLKVRIAKVDLDKREVDLEMV